MYNITTEIGGLAVPVDAIAVTVRIEAKRGTASITTSAFERGGIEYAIHNPTDPPRYRVDAELIGRRVLEAAGAEGFKPVGRPAPPAGYLDEIEEDDETDDLQKWRAFAFAWVPARRRCSDLREGLHHLLRRLVGGDNSQAELDQLRASLDEARDVEEPARSEQGNWGFVARRVSDGRVVTPRSGDTVYWTGRGRTKAEAASDVQRRAERKARESVRLSVGEPEDTRAAELDALEGIGKPRELVKMRLGGGHIVHLVPSGSERAVCRAEPRSHRGAWRRACQHTAVTCKKCNALERQDGGK